MVTLVTLAMLAMLVMLAKLEIFFVRAPPRLEPGGGGMVGITQLVRVSVCGSESRGFNSHYPPIVGRLIFGVSNRVVLIS